MKRKPPPLIAPIEFLENRWLTHGLFWIIVSGLLFGGIVGQKESALLFKMIGFELLYYIVFSYIILLFLIPFFLYNARFTLFILLGALLNILFAYIDYKTTWYYIKDIPGAETHSLLVALPIFVLFFFLITAIKLGKDLLIVQHENEMGQREKMQQELNFLRAQLSPHFLLNTMNNLYGLSVVKSDLLPHLMLRLSDLLRYSLYDTKTDKVFLKNEVDYLLDYIELQKIRLSPTVKLSVVFPTEIPENATIVPLLLVVFVENAFKHSMNSANGKVPFIHFNISLDGDHLFFVAENSFEKQVASDDGFKIEAEGIGLQTTLRRIELLYGKDSLPKITTENGCYRVELNLKFSHGKN